MILFGAAGIYKTISEGVGTWGLNSSVSWGFDITNFVYWIGVAHAGTLISAILYLFHQKWREPIHGMAEALTLISLVIAAIFPLVHTGRPWLAFYWLFPYPNQMGIWINFKSPMIWDFFAIAIYFCVSLLFWLYGMIPQFAISHSKQKSKIIAKLYFLLGLGWSGSDRQWHYYWRMYTIFAGIITALVISVHSIVSYDFAVTVLPGWHSTLFPPYFVTGAIYSGSALVIIILIITKIAFKLEKTVFTEQLDKLNRFVLAGSLLLAYFHVMELLSTLFNHNEPEKYSILWRATGDLAPLFWFVIASTIILPQLYWHRKFRINNSLTLIISIFISIGMWLERLVIIVSSLERDRLVSSWSQYFPTWVELSLTVGGIGAMIFLYLIVIRIFPVYRQSEL
jgi:Ni/Fe-hydrogenase subunit HybB-like protein